MPKQKKQRCYIYLRVSTQMQVEGYSLDAQRDRLRKEAAHRGMDVAREFADEGISGKNILDRPAFAEMLRLIESGNPDGVSYVLVFKLSRFGRNAADILNSLQLLQDYSVNLLCVEDGIDSSSAVSRILFVVLAGISELERETIAAQTMAGRMQKAREGGWNGGQAPLGYRIAKDADGRSGRLEIDEEEAELVRMIFDKFAHTGMGYSGVAKWLNAEGYRRDVRQCGRYALFTSSTVKHILENPVYTGKIAYGRTGKEQIPGERGRYRSVKRDAYDTYDGRHEAIIPDELFQEAQAKRLATKGKPQEHYGPKYVHMLSGILRCPGCGSPMYGRVVRQKRRDGSGYYPDRYYYICTDAIAPKGKGCTYKRSLREDPLDGEAIAIAQILADNAKFRTDALEAIGKPEDLDALAREMEKLEGEKRKQMQKRSRLLGKIMDLDADDDQYDSMYAALEEILHKISEDASALDGRIAELDARIHNAKAGASSAEKIMDAFRSLMGSIKQWSAEMQRFIAHEFFESIEIYPEPLPDGRQIRYVRLRIAISSPDGMDKAYDLDMGDDDDPPSGDGPSGGTPQPDGSDPSSSSGDVSPAGDSFPMQEHVSSH